MKDDNRYCFFITAILLSMLLSGCGADHNDSAASYSDKPYTDIVTRVEPEMEDGSETESGNAGKDESGDPSAAEDETEGETGDTSSASDDTHLPSAPEDSAADTGPAPAAGTGSGEYHRPTAEERRLDHMQMYLDYCTLQADVETDRTACVVDVRTAENPYDVVWDYGYDYNNMVSYSDWSLVFDADYYMEQFPVLAYQYHYDEELLLQHFQTVGVHEGRQGSEKFNVADYMSKCSEDVKDLFGDCYAAYYFYWMLEETDRSMDVSGEEQPRQMTVVLTVMQAHEFEQVNALREEKGLEPYVFDSELAALGNFRGWVDAEEDWPAHEWLHANEKQAYDLVCMIGAASAGENTVKHYGQKTMNWYYNYYNSKPHYEAMVSTDYVYFGCSNAYLGDCGHHSRGIVMVEFDMFSAGINTALNP